MCSALPSPRSPVPPSAIHRCGFLLVQDTPAPLLVLAANTAFNGFPILASILGQDGYTDRLIGRRGDRLVFSNGIVILATLAGLLIWVFDASTSRLIQLYILGVFVDVHAQPGRNGPALEPSCCREASVPEDGSSPCTGRAWSTAAGAILTATVLVVVLITKFTHGAYLVDIVIPTVVGHDVAHPSGTTAGLPPSWLPSPGGIPLPSRVRAVVLVSSLHKPTLQAMAYARATHPSDLTALTVASNWGDTQRLEQGWGGAWHPRPADRDRRSLP